MPKHKIPYFTFHLITPDKKTSEIRATNLFGIPFIRLLFDGKPLWVPMWGITGCVAAINNLRLIPDNQYIVDMQKMFIENFLPTNRTYSLLCTLKCTLISIALREDMDMWGTEYGKLIQDPLCEQYAEFFNRYEFELVDSKLVLNPYEDGITLDSPRIHEYRKKVNTLLRGRINYDLDENFNNSDWTSIALDLNPLLIETKPCQLKLPVPTIDRFFSNKYAVSPHELVQVKYTLTLPIETNLNAEQQALRQEILEFANSQYDLKLQELRNESTPEKLAGIHAKIMKVKEYSIVFLADGHVLAYMKHGLQTMVHKKKVHIFVALSLSLGQLVVVKASKAFTPGFFPLIRDVVGKRGIINISTLSLAYIDDAYMPYPAIVTPLYDCTLFDVLDSYNLTPATKHKIFTTLISALAKIHATPILVNGVIKQKLFHGDIKLENFFVRILNDKGGKPAPFSKAQTLLPEDIEVYIGDLDTAGIFSTNGYTLGYVSPELAEKTLDGINKLTHSHSWLETTLTCKHRADIWALGIALAIVLQNDGQGITSHLDFLTVVLNIDDEVKSLKMSAQITQFSVDRDINKMINNLPAKSTKSDDAILRAMWEIIRNMLQVDPLKSKDIFTLAKEYVTAIQVAQQPKLIQTKIADFTKGGKFYKPTNIQKIKDAISDKISPIKSLIITAIKSYAKRCWQYIQMIGFKIFGHTGDTGLPTRVNPTPIAPIEPAKPSLPKKQQTLDNWLRKAQAARKNQPVEEISSESATPNPDVPLQQLTNANRLGL